MKADEFIKKFGWERAKELVNGLKVGWYTNGIKTVPAIVLDNGETWVNYDDLKRLVESHELVEACGGIDVVKRHLKEGNVFRFEEKPLMGQAIADVESCQ